MDKTIETLIKSKGLKSVERWYPTGVEVFRKGIVDKMDSSIDGAYSLGKNIAYNLQYLQFLDKEMKELELSSVVYVMLVKSFVITSMGIIEGIFSHVIKKNGLWKKINEEEIYAVSASRTDSDGTRLIIRTIINKEIPPIDGQMTLDEMIKVLDRHHSALKIDHLIYPQLKRIRQLRNKVHLQGHEDKYDHDFNAFDSDVKKETSEILYAILCSDEVSDPSAIINYDFLK